VTEELRTKNEELVRANAELRELDHLKDEFVDLVSHELRAPLTNINASVELLLARDPADGAREKLEIIGHEASRLTALVRNVLDISRMQAGRLDLLSAPVDAAELVGEAVARQGPAVSGHDWRVAIAPGTPPVLADAERIGEALGNLLSNAAKYSPPGSRVDLSVGPAPDGEGVLFSVTDRGVGIPPGELDRIFERFHRVERGDARETYGHGLGLYIARRIIEAHGGWIRAESTPGEGSTFLFTLPAAPEEC
jgi:signal transduction histidine kinase